MRLVKLIVGAGLLLLVSLSGVSANFERAKFQADPSREVFWEKFRTAVIKKDKATVASLSQFPISMPYGIPTVRTKAQLIKRYRDVFNHESDASTCFVDAKPVVDDARPKEFTVGCKNAAGDEVVIYTFALTKAGWRFKSLDNLNE